MSDKIKCLLIQKSHDQDFPYYSGNGTYFGIECKQVGDELIANVEESLVESLLASKKFKKLSANAYKELKAEAK